MNSAILYTFRRCPYAMRARIGLHLSQLNPLVREIELKHKPTEMLAISAKGTVPVFVTADNQVISESIDIMRYALTQHPVLETDYLTADEYRLLLYWLDKPATISLIHANDDDFKPWLDKYKYADRYPQHNQLWYRQHAEQFIQLLENTLQQHKYLCTDSPTLADFAIFPFIRQFANVEPIWFNSTPYPKVNVWLTTLINSPLFNQTMYKYPLWLPQKNRISLKHSTNDAGQVIPLCKN
ncbi:glutathione S-transferase [Shewanella livingstonensis]|uniref:Glutathione S-transferase n=1 Tax=Shewanella livingstonensis TaxID=150120 RepID=A0A3G8LYC4_9GAMM|nr:glutathione S-transferase [Shewanella livingstonensis]AZG73698.1 glutathione S-transferase [Shewanella livingstonensis]